MSKAFAWLSRIKPSRPTLRSGSLLNRSGNAGPRRLLIIIVSGLAVL